MNKCRWCEERIEKGGLFCDDLCERLYQDYWSTSKPASRQWDQERAKNNVMSNGRRTRYG